MGSDKMASAHEVPVTPPSRLPNSIPLSGKEPWRTPISGPVRLQPNANDTSEEPARGELKRQDSETSAEDWAATSQTPPGLEFERRVAAFFEQRGLYAQLTPHRDSGVDIKLSSKGRFSKTRLHALVQCKDYPNGQVGGPELQRFVGAMHTYRTSLRTGYFITSGGFTKAARQISEQRAANERGRLELYDRERLTREGFYSAPRSSKQLRWRTFMAVASLIVLLVLGVAIGRFSAPSSWFRPFSFERSSQPSTADKETAIVDRQKQWLRPQNGEIVFAYRAAGAPSIDGRLGDWQNAKAYLVTTPVFNPDRWKGPSNSSGVLMSSWDSNNLYFAVKVTDDVFVQESQGVSLYKGDSVEIDLATQIQANFTRSEWANGDLQIGLSPGNFRNLLPEAFLWSTDGSSGHDINDAKIAAARTSDGYTLEAAIPWSELRVRPKDELVMGLCVDISDNDVAGTAQQESMVSNCPNRQWHDPNNPGQHGNSGPDPRRIS